MSRKVLFAAIAHIQARRSICRSPGEDGLVLRDGGVSTSIWLSHFCSASQHLCHRSSANGASDVSPALVSSWVMLLHSTHCFRAASGDPGWGKLISRAAINLQDFREAFFFERFVGFFPQSSPWVLHNKSLKMWNLEATSNFFIMQHLITVALSLLCVQFPLTYKTIRSTYIWWEATEVSSKAFGSKITYSQSVDCLKSSNLRRPHQKWNSHHVQQEQNCFPVWCFATPWAEHWQRVISD